MSVHHFGRWAAMQLEEFAREDRAAERSDHCARCHRPDHVCACLRGGQVLQFPIKHARPGITSPEAA